MIRCPILDNDIDIGDCVSIVNVVDGCIKEEVLSEEILQKDNWRETCQNCKYYNN